MKNWKRSYLQLFAEGDSGAAEAASQTGENSAAAGHEEAAAPTRMTWEEIKADPTLVEPFAYSLCDYLHRTLGENLSAAGWCICTTPRRRHKTGFHFSTAICEVAAQELGIPFYPDAIESHSRDRFHPDFTLVKNPKEPNVILYDDILTTGLTMRDSRQLLLESGHIVLPIVAINN